MKAYIHIICLLLVGLGVLTTAGLCREVQIGDQFASPDGRFSVQLADEDERGFNLRIRNSKTGENYGAGTSLPLLSFAWTQDSKTIVLVEHLGGGSQVVVIHFDGKKWNRLEVEPPGGDEGHYEVIKRIIHEHSVRVTYKVTKEGPNGAVVGAYLCSFDIDPASGHMSSVKKNAIDLATYRTLRYDDGR